MAIKPTRREFVFKIFFNLVSWMEYMKSARSKVEVFKKQFISLAYKAGGSHKTVDARCRIANSFLNHLKESGIKLRQIESVKTSHIESFIKTRLDNGISKRTLQNEMSAIRAILTEAGRLKLADPNNDRLNNRALGISGACRDGTKIALTQEQFEIKFKEVEKVDKGVAAAMQLAYYLGLRNEEAVQSVSSLSTWEKYLNSGAEKIPVTFGTKGNRDRFTTVINRDKVIESIKYAKTVLQNNKHNALVDKPNLKEAMERYRNILRFTAELTGENSPHSMRYAYAKSAELYYLNMGLSKKEALAKVSIDLGHGDGRGRYIKQVYRKTDVDD